MADTNIFDIIIVGGSYSGLAAAMALGRALKKVLVIDDGKPCNRQTPYSHNFLTNDGRTPAKIAELANLEVRNYNTVQFFNGTALNANKIRKGFKISVTTGEVFSAEKLIFATGIKDKLPGIDGLEACWGISILHCPYCHGYEFRGKKTGILGNGDTGFEFARLVSNWSDHLTLYINGTSTFTNVQKEKLKKRHVKIVEKNIANFEHENGYIRNIIFTDGTSSPIEAIYAPPAFEQHCKIPGSLGCELTEEGYIKVDNFYETTIKEVFAIGDNTTKTRTVANAVAMGTTAGMMISKKMIMERF